MLERTFPTARGFIELRFTERDEHGAEFSPRYLRQQHGRACAIVTRASPPAAQPFADAALTGERGIALCVRVADCAPIALWSDEVIAVVHAGWRGLVLGVIANAVEQMQRRTSGAIHGYLGPCIHEECYEFGSADLERVVAAVGPAARGCDGRSLDLPAAVGAALVGAGVRAVEIDPRCTACDAEHCYSHRARRDTGRHELIVWRR